MRKLLPSLCSMFAAASTCFGTFGAWSSLQVDKDAKPLTEVLSINVLTIATFEIGGMTADAPGEAQYWFEREHLKRKYYIPGAFSPLYCNDKGQCLIISGMGSANAAASLMALGLNSLINLRQTYILVAGIAGGAPSELTLGSAAWSAWIVGSDDRHHIDYRELPKGWKFTDFRLGCTEPWCEKGWASGNEVYPLNQKLAQWAMRLSKGVQLHDDEKSRAYRQHFKKGTAARREPFVTQCDVLAGGEYYNGKIMSEWAKWWVSNWTGNKGRYCITDMDDTGVMAGIARLASAHLVDPEKGVNQFFYQGAYLFNPTTDGPVPLPHEPDSASRGGASRKGFAVPAPYRGTGPNPRYR